MTGDPTDVDSADHIPDTAAAALHSQASRVQAALRKAGLEADVQQLPSSTRTAAQAAAALRVSVAAIAKSLVFMVDEEPVLVLTSGAHQVDTNHLAAQCGALAVHRASAQEVRTATGQAIGGVAPVGHARPLRTLIDVRLASEPVLWAAAGTPHSVFATTYRELRRLCSAQPVTVNPGVTPTQAAEQPDQAPTATGPRIPVVSQTSPSTTPLADALPAPSPEHVVRHLQSGPGIARPAGHYSPATIAAGLVFVSGQLAIDPHQGEVRSADPAEQTRQALRNVLSIVQAAGGAAADLVHVTVLLADLADFAEFDRAYRDMLPTPAPARITSQAGDLPAGCRVEIGAVAALPTRPARTTG